LVLLLHLLSNIKVELDLAEGRNTGIGKIVRAMRENGSPDPQFYNPETRSFMTVILPIHEAFKAEDSAIEAADVVIMSDNLTRLPSAVKIARKTVAIAKQNIVFAIGIKLLILLLITLGAANMWLAVFADVGVAVIAILNAMRPLGGKL